jgi:hypothetical protein
VGAGSKSSANVAQSEPGLDQIETAERARVAEAELATTREAQHKLESLMQGQ